LELVQNLSVFFDVHQVISQLSILIDRSKQDQREDGAGVFFSNFQITWILSI